MDRLVIRGFFGVALSTRGQRVYAWGNNTYGQLGRGNFDPAKDPVEITDLTNVRLSAFACGVNFFLAVSEDSPKHITSISHQISQETAGERSRQTERRNGHTPLRSPLRYEREVLLQHQVRQRSLQRSPERRIQQQLQRSRNRQNRSYQQLFLSLSADYQALLARFSALQDHL